MESNISSLTPFGQSARVVVPHNKKGGGRHAYGRDVSVYTETETVMFHEDFREILLELAKEQMLRDRSKDPVLYASVIMLEIPEGGQWLGEDGEYLTAKPSRVQGVERLNMLFVILTFEQAQSFANKYGNESYKLSYSAGASISKDNKAPTLAYIEEGKGNFSIKNNKSLVVGTDNKSRSIVGFFNPPIVNVEKYDKDKDGYTLFENGEPKVISESGFSDIYLNSIGFVQLEGLEKGEGYDDYLTAFAVSVQTFATPGNPGRIKKRKDDTKGDEVEEIDDNEDTDE